MGSPETSVAQIPLMEPTIMMVISTSMGQDQVTDEVYVSTMTASMGITNLGALSVAVGCQGATLEKLAEKDLVEGCP